MEVVETKKDKRKNNLRKSFHWNYIFYLLLIGYFLFLCFYVTKLPHREAAFNNEACYNLTTNWEYISKSGEKKEVTLPMKEENNIEDGIRISHTLPEEYSQRINTIAIWTGMRFVDVYLEGSMIYQHENANDYGKVEGSGWLIIRLPKDWQGKTLTVELTSPYPEYQGRLSECYLGTKAAILFELIKVYGFNIIISVSLFVVGIILLVAYFVLRKILKKEKGIAYLAWFQIIAAIWIFSEGCLAQFFFGNTLVVDTLTYVSLAVMPIPFLLYVYENQKSKWGKVFPALVTAHTLLAILILCLQTWQIRTMYEMVPYTHFLIVCSTIAIITTSVMESIKYKNKALKLTFYAVVALAASGMVELFYYYQGIRIYVGIFFKIGLIVSMIMITTLMLKKIFSIVRISGEAVYYEKLALLDFMTQCQNRTAYQKELEKQDSRVFEKEDIAIVVADLNNLKQMNDELGHHVGDAAIKLCAKLILQSFRELGICYRIGGDEFACILHTDCASQVQERVELFKELCEAENKEWEYEFKVAIGYAMYERKLDRCLEDTMKRADQNMYEDKRKTKIIGE